MQRYHKLVHHKKKNDHLIVKAQSQTTVMSLLNALATDVLALDAAARGAKKEKRL